MKEKAKEKNTDFMPVVAFTANENTGTNEKQYDMFPETKTAKTRQALEAEIADMKVKISQLKSQPFESEKAPVSNHFPTVSKPPVLDRVGTVSANRTDTVKMCTEIGTVNPMSFGVLGEDSFSKLYAYILTRVITKKTRPSVRALASDIHHYVKADNRLKKTVISLPECKYLATQVRDKMLKENVLEENPSYKNGLPKYLLKDAA